MNPILSINLGGYPFNIDDDAYQALSEYLKAIHNHFRSSEGYEEITSDIEARLAELFRERVGQRPIVTLADVQAAIAIMGTPAEFGAEPGEEEPTTAGEEPAGKGSSYKTGKRLFRNTEDEVIGGVCSGVAAYFGIADPIWIRVAFVVMAISGGFGIPLYIVLWVLMPEASSASDRLAMRGEPINVSNIGRIIEEEIENISKKVSTFGDELSSKFEKTKKKSPDEEILGNTFKKGVSVGVRALLNVLRFFLFLVAIVSLILFSAAWIAGVFGISFVYPWLPYFSSAAPWVLALGIANLLLLVLIPIFSIALGFTNTVFRNSTPKALSIGLAVFWTLNFISLSVVGSHHVREFKQDAELLMTNEVLPINPDQPLQLRMNQVEGLNNPLAMGNSTNNFLQEKDGLLYFNNIRVSLETSASNEVVLIRKHGSQGRSSEIAASNAQGIEYNYHLNGNELSLQNSYQLKADSKWRAQAVELTLQLPVGTTIEIDRSIHRSIHRMNKITSPAQPLLRNCSTWVMTEEGLFCPAWPDEML